MEYPGMKRQLIEACNNMMDVSAEDKKWFENNLPDRTCDNAEDVLTALLDKV